MPNTREKLIELVTVALCNQSAEEVADHLISNGVKIPVLCKDCTKISPSVTPIKDAVWCREFRAYMPIDGFCSYGERREQ